MTQSRMPARRKFRAAVVGIALVGTLAACGGSDDAGSETGSDTSDDATSTDAGEDSTAGSSGASGASASMTVDGREFTFELSNCIVQGDEIVGGGPGQDTDGTIAYMSIDFTSPEEGEVRIDVGTDQQFSSSDESYTLSNHMSPIEMSENGGTYVVEGASWLPDGSETVPASATFTCG